jgi:hypothetical protein
MTTILWVLSLACLYLQQDSQVSYSILESTVVSHVAKNIATVLWDSSCSSNSCREKIVTL